MVIAGLCSAGIVAMLSRDSSAPFPPDDYQPPAWLAAMSELAARPFVPRSSMLQLGNNSPLPVVLKLDQHQTLRYRIALEPDSKIRNLAFEVSGATITMTYEPADDQYDKQQWPGKKSRNTTPARFLIYQGGGTLIIASGSQRSQIRFKE